MQLDFCITKNVYKLNGLRAVFRLSSNLCVVRIKIVKQRRSGQKQKSNRMSIKLYRIEAKVN